MVGDLLERGTGIILQNVDDFAVDVIHSSTSF